MGISYQWMDGRTGDWQVASNWSPVGVPGSGDFATIGDASNNTSQTVTGTGSAATLNTFATTTLAGSFSIVGNLTAEFDVVTGSLVPRFGSLTIDGGSVTAGGILSANTLSLNVKDGAVVQAVGFLLGHDCTFSVDASASVTIGNAGNAAAGQLLIGPDVVVNVPEDTFEEGKGQSTASLSAPTIVNNGAISMLGTGGLGKALVIGGSNLINNGTINITDGQLQIFESGGVSGSGSINIGSNSTFFAGYFGPDTENTIHFRGTTDNLKIPTASLDSTNTFDPVVYGFNDSDVIDLVGANATGISMTYTSSAGISTLNLLNGSQVLGSIKLAGNYSGFHFSESTFEDENIRQMVSRIQLVGSGQASFGPSWNLAGIGDVNGDGTSDLVWQQQSSNLVEIQFVSRTTTLGGGTIPNSPFDSNWTLKAVGDFNGDGRSDLVYRRASDGLTEIQLLDGQAAVGGGAINNNPFDASWNIAATGDFNGDHKADLVWQHPGDGLTEIQFLDGATPIGGGLILNSPFGPDWDVAGVGDFNGDGLADLVYHRPSDGLTEIQLLNGTTPMGGGAIPNNPFGTDWSVVGIGDFNGDGFSDLVYHRASDGLTEIQFLNGTMPVGGGAIANNPFGPDWNVVGAGDFNGDGSSDLVYPRASDGLTEIQFLHGTTPVGGGIVAF